MTHAQISNEVTRLRSQVTELEGECARQKAARDRALRVEPAQFEQSAVDDARIGLSKAERRLTDVRERIDALTEQLPDANAVDHARAQAVELNKKATAARTRWDAAWGQLCHTLDTAVHPAVSALEDARAEYGEAVGALNGLADRFGLSSSVDRRLEPSRPDAEHLALVGHALAALPSGSVRDVVDRAWPAS